MLRQGFPESLPEVGHPPTEKASFVPGTDGEVGLQTKTGFNLEAGNIPESPPFWGTLRPGAAVFTLGRQCVGMALSTTAREGPEAGCRGASYPL